MQARPLVPSLWKNGLFLSTSPVVETVLARPVGFTNGSSAFRSLRDCSICPDATHAAQGARRTIRAAIQRAALEPRFSDRVCLDMNASLVAFCCAFNPGMARLSPAGFDHGVKRASALSQPTARSSEGRLARDAAIRLQSSCRSSVVWLFSAGWRADPARSMETAEGRVPAADALGEPAPRATG